MKWTWTDWFGTRLEADAVVSGLRRCGLERFRLVVGDDGLRLESPHAPTEDAAALGVTWLREQLSPLVTCRAAQVAEAPSHATVIDARSQPLLEIALAELWDPQSPELPRLLTRVGAPELLDQVATALEDQLLGRAPTPEDVRFGWLALTARGAEVVWTGPRRAARSVLAWQRPGGDTGVRPAVLVAIGPHAGIAWLAEALADVPKTPDPPDGFVDVLMDGLAWGASRRPTVAVAPPSDAPKAPIWVDRSRCTECGLCAALCPSDVFDSKGHVHRGADCVRCYECVDVCPTDTIRPIPSAESATRGHTLAHRPGWLARATGAPGPLLPAAFPPSYLLPRAAPKEDGQPTWILGVACLTFAEHAAVLIRADDGGAQIVGAVEEEKISRLRHHGYRPPGRPSFVTSAVDPTVHLEEVLPRRSVRFLLEEAGITLDDVDVIALNGLHGRYRHTFTHLDADTPLPVVRAGRLWGVPHHVCHAASAYRVSGAADAWIFTVDGRGDRETAAIFRAEDGAIRSIRTLLSLNDRSVGGVFQTVTELLGFGSYGQGSVMALAGFGDPSRGPAMSRHLAATDPSAPTIHEEGIHASFAAVSRSRDSPIGQPHRDAAAALQTALETFALDLVGDVASEPPIDALCLGGGVALNCHMNNRLRLALQPEHIFAQPGANDGGTALGAAAEVWSALGERPRNLSPMKHALLGPRYDDVAIEAALKRSGLSYGRVDDVAEAVAERLAAGEVFCWFQGRLEFGPRALGARSIVADPRSQAIKDRVNGLKTRETWRPFGPSMLAGHEAEWLEDGFDSRFMLFTLPVRPERQAQVPAIVHVDGTTRPQMVHPDTHPEYHAMISAFYRRTGVPLVLNTSFNRRGEPIVRSPEEAIESFVGLGADALAIGPFIAEAPAKGGSAPAIDLASLASGMIDEAAAPVVLRLADGCELGCAHCAAGEPHGERVRSEAATRAALAEGRERGAVAVMLTVNSETCDAAVHGPLAAAREAGYEAITVRTHGSALATEGVAATLRRRGVERVEVTLLAATDARHDQLTGRPGSLRAVAAGIKAAARAGLAVTVAIPLLRGNLVALRRIVKLAARLTDGRGDVVLRAARPIELPERLLFESLPTVSVAARYASRAAATALELGLAVRLEGLPLCHLPPAQHGLVRAIEGPTVTPRPCRGCTLDPGCSKTWATYLELVGTGELVAR